MRSHGSVRLRGSQCLHCSALALAAAAAHRWDISGNGCSELTLRTHISQRHRHIYASTLKNMPTSLDYEVPERENEISLFCRCSKCAHTSC